MSSVNQVVLVGRLGKDPEMRFTQSGDAVASFSLATSEKWNGKDGNKQERTDWHRVEVWGGSAKFVGEYAAKGSLVSVVGSIRYEDWTDKDGNKKQSTKIRAQRVELLGGGRKDGGRDEAPARPAAAAPFVATDEDVPF